MARQRLPFLWLNGRGWDSELGPAPNFGPLPRYGVFQNTNPCIALPQSIDRVVMKVPVQTRFSGRVVAMDHYLACTCNAVIPEP